MTISVYINIVRHLKKIRIPICAFLLDNVALLNM